MTDYEKLIAMFNKAKIAYDTDANKDGKTITVEAGYIGFASVFEFDKEENLLKVGAYD